MAMNEDIQKIISTLIDLKAEISRMDNKVRLYLSDRKKYPYPDHEQLIEKIRKFENQIHHIRNTEVQLRLDSLMTSLLINERHWKRLFEERSKKDEQIEKKEKKTQGETSKNQKPLETKKECTPLDSTNNQVINRIYELSLKKWEEFKVQPTETKAELEKRLLPEYQKSIENLKENEKIQFYYDKKKHVIDIKKVQCSKPSSE